MKKVRQQVFETNSSSTHSISVCSDIKNYIFDILCPNDDGQIELDGGEFGWEWEEYNDAHTKANYLSLQYQNKEELQLLTLEIMEQTGANEIIYNFNGYIDHQSNDVYPENHEIKDFIFNRNSILRTGNDNSDSPWGDDN